MPLRASLRLSLVVIAVLAIACAATLSPQLYSTSAGGAASASTALDGVAAGPVANVKPQGPRGPRGPRGPKGARGPAGSGINIAYRVGVLDSDKRTILNRSGLKLEATCGSASDNFKVIASPTVASAFISLSQVGGPQGIVVNPKFDSTVGDQVSVLGSSTGTGVKNHQGTIVFSPDRTKGVMTIDYAAFYTGTNGLSAHGNCAFLATVTVGPGL